MNVLILDDNQSSLIRTCEYIKSIPNIHCISRTEADDLTNLLLENTFDIIVTDIAVGFVSIEQILAISKKFPRLSVIVLSNKLNEEQATLLLDEGVTDYISYNHLTRLRHVLQRSYSELSTKRKLDDAITRLNNNIESKSTLIENIPGVVYRCTHKNNWKPEFMSEQCEVVTGYSFDYFHEHGYEHIVHHQDLPEVHRLIDEAVAQKNNFELNYRIFTRDGRIRYMWERGKGVFDSNGILNALEGVIVDVTTNKIREQLLQQFNETVSIEAGEKYFSRLTEFLYENLGSKLVMIGRYVEEEASVHTVSFRIRGNETENIIYSLKGTPCERVLSKELCIFNSDVQKKFPDDKDLIDLQAESYIGVPVFNSYGNPEGLVVLIDDKPLQKTDSQEQILKAVSTRVGNELEHLSSKKKLADSEAKYRTVIENQTEFIVRWNIAGKVLFANDLFLKYHSISYEELAATSYYTLINDNGRLAEKIKKLKPETFSAKDIHQSKSPSGKLVWHEWTDVATFDQHGNITEIQSIGRDITAKQNATEKLADSENILKNAQRITQTGSFIISPGNDIRIWSEEMYNIFEVSSKNFIPTLESVRAFVLDEDKELVTEMHNSLLRGIDANPIEYRIKTASGKIKFIQSAGEIIRNPEGSLLKIIGTSQDITALKLAEFEIREKEAFGEAILGAMHDSIVVINKNGIIVKSNQQWKKFALENNGPPERTDVGTDYIKVCKRSIAKGDELAANALAGIMAVLNRQSQVFEMEYPCHSETKRRWFNMRVTPMSVGFDGAVITHTDISEKRQKDEELQISINEIYVAEEINKALLENQSFEDLSRTILNGLSMLLVNSRSRMYKYAEHSHSLKLTAEKLSKPLLAGLEKKAGVKLTEVIPELISGTLFNQVITEKQFFLTHDKTEIKRIIAEHTSNKVIKKLAGWAYRFIDIKTFGLIPLIDKNRIVGLLTFSTADILTADEKQLLRRFSNHVSTILGKKTNEELIISSEEKFKAISNYTANWETWIDTNGLPKWINPGVAKLSGYSSEELLAMPDFYNQIIYHEDLPVVMSTLQKGLTDKTEGENLEFRINHRNGFKPWFSVSWKQVYNAEGVWMGIRSSGVEITERKNFESDLINKQAELSQAHEIARLGSWSWNTATESITLDRSLSHLLGFNSYPLSLKKDVLMNMIHAESRERIDLAIFNALHDFKSKEIEVRVSLPNGIEKYILIRATLSSPDYSNQPAIKGTALDITELKQSHNKSKEAEARFQKIFDSIQDVYYQTDLFGKITMVSPFVYDMLGYKPTELIGESVSMLFAKPKIQELKLARKHVLGNSELFETTLNTKNGVEISVSVKLNFLENEVGERYAVQGLIRNISEKKKQEISLENQRKRLLEIVKLNTQIIQTSDHFYYVIAIKEKNYHFKYVSGQVTDILGLSELELLRSTELWTSIIHPNDIASHKEAMRKIHQDKKPQRVSYRITNSQKSQLLWIDDYICPLMNDEGEIIEIYGSAKDSTERITALLNIEAEKTQTMAYQYQLLSSQLNPHFIYNTLNSFQYYILQGQIESSLNHISAFSNLMRKVLENSMYKFITIEDEIDFLKQYVKISQDRMKSELQFEISTQKDFYASEFMIPPMLLQPYIENSIVHGFANYEGVAKLDVHFEFDANDIKCTITDNGIGRKKAEEYKMLSGQPQKRSFAIGINDSRINLLNQITKGNFKVLILDLHDEFGKAAGTKVEITFNILMNDFD